MSYGLEYNQASQYQEQEKQNLDKTYSILTEARFLQQYPHLSPEQQQYYVSQSIYKHIDEHVGRLPYSRISGRLPTNGGLELCAVDMIPSWQRTVDWFGTTSREAYEVEGYRRAYEMIVNGADGVIISSPQKPNVDRRYTFILIKGAFGHEGTVDIDGVPITQLNIMHEGEDLDFSVARNHYSALEFYAKVKKPKAHNFTSAQDMLVEPIPLTLHNQNNIGDALRILGIDNDAIQYSYLFQRVITRETRQLVNEFVSMMLELSHQDLNDANNVYIRSLIKQAKLKRNEIFFASQEINARLKHLTGHGRNEYQINIYFDNKRDDIWEQAYYLSQTKEPFTLGASSCPSAETGSDFEISKKLEMGMTLTDILNEAAGFNCPGCGGYVPRGSGNICPHCFKPKWQIAKEKKIEICK